MSRSFVAAFGIAAALVLSTTPAIAASPSGSLVEQTAKQTDKAIQDHVEYRLEADDAIGKYDIKVKVDAGHVTLSGDVRTAAQKAAAGRIAKVDGVTTVTNDIKVDADADKSIADRTKKGLNKTGAEISDAWIITKIHWFFIGEDLLKGSDINVDCDKRIVTLKGTVASAAGRARALHLAAKPDGVKSVVDHLVIAKKK